MVRRKLNNSLMISEIGNRRTGILSDFISPEDPMILPMDWLVMLEKKNQKISPELQKMTYSFSAWKSFDLRNAALKMTINMTRYNNGLKNPQKNPTNELLYLNITFRLLSAYILVIFCTLWILLIFCSRKSPEYIDENICECPISYPSPFGGTKVCNRMQPTNKKIASGYHLFNTSQRYPNRHCQGTGRSGCW